MRGKKKRGKELMSNGMMEVRENRKDDFKTPFPHTMNPKLN